jgi:hypothetical protein
MIAAEVFKQSMPKIKKPKKKKTATKTYKKKKAP